MWLADRASTQTPSIKYSYNVRKDKVTAIKTEKIENDGSYGAEYQMYDSMLRSRQIQTEGPDGTRMVADTWYDGTGNVRKTNSTYNAAGAAEGELLLVSNGQVGAQSLLEYDGLGRSTAQISAVSGAEQWRTTTVYDGELTHVDPPVGGVPTTTITDNQGNLSEIRHYRGAAPGVGVPYDSTKYTYNTAGLLETVTDAKSNVWRYEYDQLGRKTKSIDPDAGTSRTEYDELDRPVVAYDGRNKKTSTSYDKLGRVTTTWLGDPDTGTKLTETKYDKAGWLGQAYGSLSYITPTEYFASAVQSMDEFYRPLKTAYQVPVSQGSLAGTYVYTSTYNRDGTLQTSGLPAIGDLPAEVLTYTYDALQRPKTMTGTTDSYVTDTVYNRNSQLQQLELFKGGSGKKVWQTYGYETGTDRLTRSLVDVYGATAPAKDSTYSYDQAGNVLSIADTANSGAPDVQCFAYDGRQRLQDAWTPSATAATAAGSGSRGSTTPVNGTGPTACDSAAGSTALGGPSPYWKSYETDAIGNRVSEINHDTGLNAANNITRSYEYGGAGALGDGPHQVTKVTETIPTGTRQSSYEYDDAGNTTKRTTGGNAQILAWDDTGALSKVTEGSGAETGFLYDAYGNRVQRKDPSGTTVYLPGTELKLSTDGTKKEATRYYDYAGETVAVRTASNLSFVAADHHGTGELAIDAATGAVSQRRFDPFGVDRGTKSGTWPGEKGFVGGTIDASTGLTHLGAREYDSAIGKFISVDPIIDYTQPQQINGYAYANNSPVTHADPSGMIIPECREGLIECRGGMPVTNTDPEVSKAQSDVSKASGDVAAAQQQQSSARQRIKSAGKALIKIARDILGVDAALDCISSGDVGACGETLLNIAGSFAGGLAGKILAKYGAPWKWAKGLKLAKRVTGLVKDMIGGVKGLWNANKAVGRAKLGLSKAAEKLAEVRKKAAAARKKKGADDDIGGSCPFEGKHSFLPGTKVLLAHGKTKPIEKVKLGDKIIVTDPKTGKTAVREVVGTIVTEDDKQFVDLTVKGTSGKAEALVSTTTHPFWSESGKKWVEAATSHRVCGCTRRTATRSTSPRSGPLTGASARTTSPSRTSTPTTSSRVARPCWCTTVASGPTRREASTAAKPAAALAARTAPNPTTDRTRSTTPYRSRRRRHAGSGSTGPPAIAWSSIAPVRFRAAARSKAAPTRSSTDTCGRTSTPIRAWPRRKAPYAGESRTKRSKLSRHDASGRPAQDGPGGSDVSAWRAALTADVGGSDLGRATRALLALTYDDPDREAVEALLLECLDPGGPAVDPQVTALAVTCAGHVARLHGAIDVRLVARVRDLLQDPVLGGRAEDAVDDIASFAPAALEQPEDAD